MRSIECIDVNYRYEGSSTYSLEHVTASIPAKGMTAIVGKSGAGKSTLIDLIMGLVRPESGQILIDGVPLSEEQLLAWRSSIGYVSQDPFLFHTSIRENLRLVDPDASEEQMWQALQFSSSAAFVRKLPHGLDTMIGDRGIRLSEGNASVWYWQERCCAIRLYSYWMRPQVRWIVRMSSTSMRRLNDSKDMLPLLSLPIDCPRFAPRIG